MIPTQTLNRFIHLQERDHPDASGELSDLLSAIGLGVKLISRVVATAGFKGLHGYTGRTNVQGELTHKLDEEADEILIEILGSSGHFGSLVSEEQDDVISTEAFSNDAKYVVAFDPLDGSSNIGSNIPVGTIFTVFKRKDTKKPCSVDDFLQTGREIVASGYSVYGSMTSFVYCAGHGVHGFTLDPYIGEFMLTEQDIRVPSIGKDFSVNEGYWEKWDDSLQRLVQNLKGSENPKGSSYSARYVGSLVADFDRTLRRGGIFLHPANKDRGRGKLRLLYECMPLAFIAEHAGGMAVDGKVDVLDIKPAGIHERCPFIVGSKAEVNWVMKCLAEKN